jgi:cobalamin biosynthesis Mg chelatase CobN
LREFAYGRGGSSKAAVASSDAELEALLRPTAPLSKVRAARAVSGARALSESARAGVNERPVEAKPALPAGATAASSQSAIEPEREVSLVQKASPQEARSYAAREARSKAQQQYRGGDVVVITASTLVIVLLIVLLVVLLIR